MAILKLLIPTLILTGLSLTVLYGWAIRAAKHKNRDIEDDEFYAGNEDCADE